MPDWKAIRAEFPALRHWTYLNTATYGHVPERSVRAVAAHFARRDELACGDYLSWFDDADRIRESLARLVNAQADDIAFFQNASSALSLLAGGIDWRPGDRILTFQNEFPNNLYWGAHMTGGGVQYDEVAWPEFEQAMTPRTRLVMVCTVNYTTGLRPSMDRIAELCRLNGALLYVDGTQSLGGLRFDCQSVAPDMFAVDGYKWLLSPNGAGFAYVSPRLRSWLKPSVIGWRSDRRWREVNALHHGMPEFKESAEKYEGAMLPFPVLYAMGATVDWMHEIGPAAIEERVLSLAHYARQQLRGIGARLLADESPDYISPVIAARFDGHDAVRIAETLKARRVLVAARHGNLRVSTHFYNDESDIDRLAAELKAIL